MPNSKTVRITRITRINEPQSTVRTRKDPTKIYRINKIQLKPARLPACSVAAATFTLYSEKLILSILKILFVPSKPLCPL